MAKRKPKASIKCTECGSDIFLWPYIINGIKDQSTYVCVDCKSKNIVSTSCLQCGNKFESRKRQHRKFCCKSCSASYNNKRVDRTEERNQKVSSTLKRKYATGAIKRAPRLQKFCRISYKKCTGCGEYFIRANAKGNSSRNTCSSICSINACVRHRTYQNGSRKPSWYFNKNQNKQVLLESSWEVATAKELDALNIRWIRPEPLEWFNDRKRYYYPDFI